MKLDAITFELLPQFNITQAREIWRDDRSEAFADTVDTIMVTQYGLERHCKGHTYAIKQKNEYIGLILLGEAYYLRYPSGVHLHF